MQIDLSQVRSWPPPNYVNPETRGLSHIFVELFLFLLATVVLGFRVYTRRFISKSFGWDDVLILVAYVSCVGGGLWLDDQADTEKIPATAFTILGIYCHFVLGWDRHIWDARPFDLGSADLKASLALQILFDIATNLIKISMLLLIWRMAALRPGKTKWAVLITMNITAVNTVIFIFVTVFSCKPINDLWTLSVDPQQCLNQSLHLFIACIINTVMAFVVVLLPMKIVMTLDLPRKQRAIVVLLFACGILTASAGVVRTYYTYIWLYAAGMDYTWHAHEVVLLAVVEMFLGITCASIPATKPFFSRYLPRLLPPQFDSAKISKISKNSRGTDLVPLTSVRASQLSTKSCSIYIINDTTRPSFQEAVGDGKVTGPASTLTPVAPCRYHIDELCFSPPPTSYSPPASPRAFTMTKTYSVFPARSGARASSIPGVRDPKAYSLYLRGENV